MSFHILHLSDLHFGASHEFDQNESDPHKPSMTESVGDVLPRDLQIDCLILSGDFFSKKQDADLKPAVRGVRELMQRLKIKGSQVLCVPGNHDVDWGVAVDQRFVWYEKFVNEIGARGAKPSVEIFRPGGKPIAFVLMNSCQLEGRETSGYGLVGDDQLRTLSEEIKRLKVSGDSHHVFGVLHHHLLPLWRVYRVYDPLNPIEGKPARYSMTADAGEVMSKLRKWGAIGAMHGHQHYAAIVSHRNELAQENDLRVFAAGSVSAKVDANEPINRHFFSYHVTDTVLEVTSFRQDRDNPEAFVASPRVIRVPLARTGTDSKPVALDQLHHAACKVEEQTEINHEPDVAAGDSSDLFYLFLNVVDCGQSREVIKRLVSGLVGTTGWTDDSYFELLGMYHLLGRWDLAVRFRTNIDIERGFLNRLKSTLLQAKLVFRKGEFGIDQMEVCNITREGKGVKDLLGQHSSREHKRLVMYDTERYEESRCQRGLVRISLPDRKVTPRFLRALSRSLEHSPGAQIIELMCLRDNTLLLEVFMRCSQSSLIARLNRDIEAVLTQFKCQKSTMLCYGYDEHVIRYPRSRPHSHLSPRSPTRSLARTRKR